MSEVVIIGGGLVGLATAYKWALRRPDTKITVLEKEDGPGRHQSTHNSGVLHCGLYYKPDSMRARLAVGGIREMTEFCREHGVRHEICGKLVVAADETEVPRLHQLQERGTQNGLRGLRWLEGDAMKEIEPHVGGVAGLHVPEEGIADYAGVVAALCGELEKRGARIVSGAKVTALKESEGWIAETPKGPFHADFIVNCAGLHCDRVGAMAGEADSAKIVPFRGEYFQLRKERESLVRNLIYPVPNPTFPFLGVHFTRRITGGIEAGPNAVLALSREGYRWTDFNLGDALEALGFSGLRRFLSKHRATCWAEVRRSFSKKLFCRTLQRLVPDIREEDLEPGGAGVRAQMMSPEGELIQDFRLVRGRRSVHVLNAPSPAATASLAIAGEIVAFAAA